METIRSIYGKINPPICKFGDMRYYLSIVLLLLLSQVCIATTITVSDITSLNDAIDDVVPGDIIEMEDGIWMNATIIFDANGTSANPIILRAQNPGGVILSGETEVRIGGDYLIVSGLVFEDCTTDQSNLIAFRRTSTDLAQHSRLTDCVIKNCNPNDTSVDYKWVGLFGTYNEVDHCYMENKNHEGPTIVVWSDEDEAHHHIHHNYFGPSPEGDGNGWETIRIGTSSWAQYAGYNLVEHNYFYQRDGEIEIISGKSSFSTYRYNIFKECKGGLTLRHGTDCTVDGNIFFGGNKSGSYGVRTIDRNHTVINNYFEGLNGASSELRYPICLMGGEVNPAANGYQPNINNNISYNTIVNCTKGIMVGAEDDWPVAPDDCTFANNVVSIANAAPVVHNNAPTNSTYVGNFFYRSDGNVTIPSTGYQDIDPQLSVPVGDSIYRPENTSPLIGAAVTGWSVEDNDFEFQSRPNTPTVGADDISSDAVIDRGIYGPTWMIPVNEEEPQYSVLMEAEDAIYGSQWSLENDVTACGSAYLLPPDMSSTATPPTMPEDLVTFSFSLIESGTYKVYARTMTSDGSDDSFWVRANNGNWQRWNTINGPNYPSGYHWSQVGDWVTGDPTAIPVTFELLEGSNTIDFAWRENDARLDKIFVTQEDLLARTTVTNHSIGDPYSLGYNIENACPSDTIYFAENTNNISFPLDANTFEIDIPLTIIGNNSTQTVIDGLNLHQIFINTSSHLSLQELRLSNAFSAGNGGAILNYGELSLTGVVFDGNYEGINPKAFTNYGIIYILENGEVYILE